MQPQPHRPPSERELFLAALDCTSPTERAAFLRRACGGNHTLRASVEALLALHREDDFLEKPQPNPGTPTPPTPQADPHPTPAPPSTPPHEEPSPGHRIGPYKLLQQIGEGGAGAVFMAEQEEPVRRRVALKIVKPGMDTKSVIARFETERQALALMDHPNIAKVLDAGSTPTGRPFFVMELVRGTRITTYCDENHLSTRQRLRLFIQVCHAIQHAHQKGIIHRDIKPSNILVTLHDGIPVPKVIDFGIAKAVGQRLSHLTVFTEFHAFIGTPAYMSPEQAEMSGLDIDTRSDVYSLGVLLYEILTGRPPFDPQELASSGLDGMRRTIREREPLAPSTRLRTLLDAERTTTANRHRVEPARLENLLRGDLDWIVLKALEKDRTRRYATASDLAQDVQLHLDEEPISARPPSAWYRIHKLTRRHRLACAASAAFAAAILLGASLATWQYFEKSAALGLVQSAQLEERRLRQEAQQAEASEALLRRQAQAQELRARRRAYAADLNLAQHALSINNLGRARELLGRQLPGPAEPDLRGWEWRYLWGLCRNQALFTLPSQTGEVSSLTISTDQRWLAAATSAGRITLTDLRSRQTLDSLDTAIPRPRIAFSPTQPLLAYSASDPTPTPNPSPGPANRRQRLLLWNPVERRATAELPLRGSCLALAFATNGLTLAIATSDGQVTLWNPDSPTPPSSLPLPNLARPGTTLEFSPDLRLVAGSTPNGLLQLFDLHSGRRLWSVRAGEETLRAIRFTHDGSRLATGTGFSDSAARLWDTSSGTELARLEGHRGWISALAFWPDGQTLATASADQTIRLWDLRGLDTNSHPVSLSTPPPHAVLRGHQLEVWSLALAHPLGILVSGSKDGSILAWDTTRQTQEPNPITLPEPVRAWSFTPQGSALRTLDPKGQVTRWQGPDFQERIVEATLAASPADAPFPLPAFFSSDSRILVVSQPHTPGLTAIDLDQGSPLDTSGLMTDGSFPLGFLPGTHRLMVRRFADRSIQEWDLDTRAVGRSWSLPEGSTSYPFAAFSPDAQWWLLPADRSQTLLHHPLEHLTLPIDLGALRPFSTTFSPDSRRFAAIGGSGIGEIWETSPPRRIAPITGFLQGLASIAFSNDGSRLVIGSDHREALKIFDGQDFHELLTLPATGSRFLNPSFSPDGLSLAAHNSRGTLFIWRAAAPDEAPPVLPNSP